MLQHMSQTDGGGGRVGGAVALWKSFLSNYRQRPATSTFCTYCGDWVKCTP